MTELEQLKADLSVLRKFSSHDQPEWEISTLIDVLETKLAKLKAEAADPHREAKQTIDRWERKEKSEHLDRVARYVRHLEDRNAAMKEALDEWDIVAWKILPGHDSPPLPSHVLRRHEELRQHAIELEKMPVPPLDPKRVHRTAMHLKFRPDIDLGGWPDLLPYPLEGEE